MARRWCRGGQNYLPKLIFFPKSQGPLVCRQKFPRDASASPLTDSMPFERRSCLWYRLTTMNRRILKSSVVLVLTFSLFYSGLAWAMAACLRSHGHSQNALFDDHHHSDGLIESNHPDEPMVPVIHCASINEQIGPAVRLASAEIRRSDKSAPLHAASPSDALSAVLRNDLCLEALFKRIVTFSLPIDFARHLFLSILRI